MRAIKVAAAIVWTVLLVSIAYELHSLNRSLAWLRVDPSVTTAAAPTETRDQRRERYRREVQDASDRLVDRLDAAQATAARSSSATPPPVRK